MNILLLTENFPPETNAAATRLHEKACYWVRWGHSVTVVTNAPNFPDGILFDGYRNRWRQTEVIDGIRVVRVKTYIAPNRGVVRRSLEFLSFGVHRACTAGLFVPRPDVVIGNSPQLFAAAAALRRSERSEAGTVRASSSPTCGRPRSSLSARWGDPLPLRMLEILELHLYRRAAAVVALTAGIRDNLVARGIPSEEKIAVVRNGVDLARYGPRPRDEALAQAWGLGGRFVVGYVGTHGMAHGLGKVLDDGRAAARSAGRWCSCSSAPGPSVTMLIADARQSRPRQRHLPAQAAQGSDAVHLEPVRYRPGSSQGHAAVRRGAADEDLRGYGDGPSHRAGNAGGRGEPSPPRYRRGRLGPARRPGGIGLRHPLAARRPRDSATPRGREPCCSTEPQPGGPGPRHVAGAGAGRSGGIAREFGSWSRPHCSSLVASTTQCERVEFSRMSWPHDHPVPARWPHRYVPQPPRSRGRRHGHSAASCSAACGRAGGKPPVARCPVALRG